MIPEPLHGLPQSIYSDSMEFMLTIDEIDIWLDPCDSVTPFFLISPGGTYKWVDRHDPPDEAPPPAVWEFVLNYSELAGFK
jgi:hypothetical protein